MSCPSCTDGYLFREFAIPGGKRYKRVRCDCNPEPPSAASSRQSPRFSMRAINRRFETDYREDLSRFPGDPQARVSSPGELRALIDRRKREGWRIGERTIEDVANAKPPDWKPGEQVVREAYEAAKARNFEPEVVSG